MKEPIMVTRSSMPPMEEYFAEIKELWDTHYLTNMGPKHKKLQYELEKYLETKNVELLTNGHMALELSLQALGLEDNSRFEKKLKLDSEFKNEVITTPFTFASTTHAIVRNGLEPVFCDIDPSNFTIDVNKLESLITSKTVAILPVHVYGNICDVKKIEYVAKKYALKVVYDAAHAFGEQFENTGIGNFGDISCFSFHATKVFNTIEGGAVCYKNEEFGKELYRLKNFGIKDEEIVDGIGANAKLNEFCAAMGICNLKYLDEEIKKRKIISEKYDERLSDIKGIQLRKIQEKVKSNYAYYPILIDEKLFGINRDELYLELKKHNIFTRKYFYPLTNTFDCFEGKYDVFKTPIAKQISEKVLTLPLYSDLDIEIVDRICDTILEIKSKNF